MKESGKGKSGEMEESNDSLRNREVRDSEGRWRMEEKGKRGSVKRVVGGNCEENAVCRKERER